MAEETGYQRVESLPPNYLSQYYAGVPGQNVPGIMPLMNQELVNRMMGFGVEGANPYTYSGNRIAGFNPAQQEAFRMTSEGMGAYSPYFQRGEQLTEQGINAAQGGFNTAQNRQNQAVQAGEQSTQEGMNLLRQAPGIGQGAYNQGMGQIGQAGNILGQAQNIAGGAGVNLNESQNMIRNANADSDLAQAQQMTMGSRFDPTGAANVMAGGLNRLGESAQTGYGATGRFSPGDISSFQNPYEDQVVQQTMDDIQKGFAQGDIARRAGAIGAGAFGGSRSQLQGQDLAESTARGAAQQIGAIRAGGYQDSANRAQQSFENQQGRQAGQANLLAGLGSQQSSIGGQLGQLGLGTSASNRAAAGQFGQMGLAGAQQGMSRGQALGNMGLAGQTGQLRQAGALGQMAGQRAGMGGQMAGMGQNLAGLYGSTAGGLGSLGGNMANIYGGAGRDAMSGGAQLGQLYGAGGNQMANFGQGISGLMGQDINRMAGMGGMQQGMDQRNLDLAYGNFVGNYNLPFQTISQFGNAAAGMAPSMGGTQIAQSQQGTDSNPLMQGLGTALTAYGAMN